MVWLVWLCMYPCYELIWYIFQTKPKWVASICRGTFSTCKLFFFSKCFFKPWWQFHVDFFLNVSWRKTFLTSSWFSGQSYWKQSRFFSFSWFMCFSLKFLGLSNERVGVGIEIEIGVRVGTGIDYTSIVTGIDFKTDLPFYSFPPWENLGWNNVDSWRKWHP